METKDPKSTESAGETKGPEAKDPGSDATSSETLSDVENSEKVSGTEGGAEEGGDGSRAPSPDGAFDEGRGEGTSGINDPGPM